MSRRRIHLSRLRADIRLAAWGVHGRHRQMFQHFFAQAVLMVCCCCVVFLHVLLGLGLETVIIWRGEWRLGSVWHEFQPKKRGELCLSSHESQDMAGTL